VLKLSAGDDHELNHIISILLGYDEDDTAQKKDNSEQKNKIVALLEDTAYSHLLEVLFFVFLLVIGIQYISFIVI
jgi:nucleolar protein 9